MVVYYSWRLFELFAKIFNITQTSLVLLKYSVFCVKSIIFQRWWLKKTTFNRVNMKGFLQELYFLFCCHNFPLPSLFCSPQYEIIKFVAISSHCWKYLFIWRSFIILFCSRNLWKKGNIQKSSMASWKLRWIEKEKGVHLSMNWQIISSHEGPLCWAISHKRYEERWPRYGELCFVCGGGWELTSVCCCKTENQGDRRPTVAAHSRKRHFKELF